MNWIKKNHAEKNNQINKSLGETHSTEWRERVCVDTFLGNADLWSSKQSEPQKKKIHRVKFPHITRSWAAHSSSSTVQREHNKSPLEQSGRFFLLANVGNKKKGERGDFVVYPFSVQLSALSFALLAYLQNVYRQKNRAEKNSLESRSEWRKKIELNHWVAREENVFFYARSLHYGRGGMILRRETWLVEE